MTTMSIGDLHELVERVDFEAKKAGGLDGQGECPKAFFESYSAMANTQGGVILLGGEERDKKLRIVGIPDIARVLKALWDGLNNPQRVNVNLLSDRQVEVREVDGKRVVLAHVPRASRQQRPVHVGDNPFKGTYVRNGEGDYLVRDDEVVRRMLAERVEDSRDGRILPNYTLEDIDAETLARYRNYFKTNKPDHVWNGLEDREFLRSIGGWRRDRETSSGGLTTAGLLMFGRHPAIVEEFPFYMVDYQERPEAKADGRWIDRIVPVAGRLRHRPTTGPCDSVTGRLLSDSFWLFLATIDQPQVPGTTSRLLSDSPWLPLGRGIQFPYSRSRFRSLRARHCYQAMVPF